MKQRKGYQIRAYELESEEREHEKPVAQIPVVEAKQKNFSGHPQKGTAWQVETFLDSKKAHGVKSPQPPKAKKLSKAKAVKKKKPPRKRWFARKEKAPEVSPLDSGATTIPDILAPASIDLTNRDYVVVDGIFHAYLYIAGYGYTSAVTSGWLSPLAEIGEGINLSFITRRQQKDKVLPKIAQTTMVNRSRMRDVGDTRQDYEELDSAINSGLWIVAKINFYNYGFCAIRPKTSLVRP